MFLIGTKIALRRLVNHRAVPAMKKGPT